MTGEAQEGLRAAAGSSTRLSGLCSRLIEAGWLVGLAAVPLLVTDGARRYEPGKVALVRAIGCLVSLLLFVRLLEARRSRRRSLIGAMCAAFRTPLVRPVLFVVLAHTASTALSIAPRISLWGSFTRLQGLFTLVTYVLLFGAVATALRTREQLERLVSVVILTSVPVGLYAVVQRYDVDPLGLVQDPRRVSATLGMPTFLGAYVTLVIPVTLARLVGILAGASKRPANARRRTPRASGYALVLALQATTVLFSQSRGAALGLFAALSLFALLAFLVLQPAAQAATSWRRARAALVAGVAGIVMLVVALNLRGTVLDAVLDPLRRAPYLDRIARIAEVERGTGRVRALVWSSTLGLLGSREPIGIPSDELAGPDPLHGVRPLIGYGPETMFNTFASVYPAELAHAEARDVSFDRAHNEVLDTLVTTGLVGLCAKLLLIGAIFFHSLAWLGLAPDRRTRSRLAATVVACGGLGALLAYAVGSGWTFVALGSSLGLFAGVVAFLTLFPGARGPEPVPGARDALVGAGFLAALAGHFVAGQFGFPVATDGLYFWVYAGALVALVRGLQAGAEQGAPALPRDARLLTRTAWAAAPLAAGVTALIWSKSLDVVRADLSLARGDRASGGRDVALELHGKARALDPGEDRYSLAIARDYQLMAQDSAIAPDARDEAWRLGEQAVLEARRLNPYSASNTANVGRHYFTWATATGERARFEQALDFFGRAIHLSPENVALHYLRGQALYALHRYRALAERLEDSLAVDARYPPTWTLLGDAHAALGAPDEALRAHCRAMELSTKDIDGLATFADGLLDRRLRFYVASDRTEDIVAAMLDAARSRPGEPLPHRAVGRALFLAGENDRAAPHLQRAVDLGDPTGRARADLAAVSN